MKFILKKFKLLVLLAALVTGVTMQAMEDQNEPEHINTTDTVIERICTSFDPLFEEAFKETPKNFYEAIVRLQCIAQLLGKSSITLKEGFYLTKNACIINDNELPLHMAHSVFQGWLDGAHKQLLLSHKKSKEAIEIILEAISKKVRHETVEQYQKAVTNLPPVVAKYIAKKFISMHGWPHNIKPHLTFDTNGDITSVEFATNQCHINSQPDHFVHVYSQPEHFVRAESIEKKSGRYIKGSSSYINGRTLDAFENVCTSLRLIHMQESGVYNPLWQKPTFEQALKKRAQENEESQNASIVTRCWNYLSGK